MECVFFGVKSQTRAWRKTFDLDFNCEKARESAHELGVPASRNSISVTAGSGQLFSDAQLISGQQNSLRAALVEF